MSGRTSRVQAQGGRLWRLEACSPTRAASAQEPASLAPLPWCPHQKWVITPVALGGHAGHGGWSHLCPWCLGCGHRGRVLSLAAPRGASVPRRPQDTVTTSVSLYLSPSWKGACKLPGAMPIFTVWCQHSLGLSMGAGHFLGAWDTGENTSKSLSPAGHVTAGERQ